MKALILATAALGFSIVCNAQQRQKESPKVKFTPPVIVKDETAMSKPTIEVVKFTPPVIVKDKSTKSVKAKRVKKVKFTPPVIVKDTE